MRKIEMICAIAISALAIMSCSGKKSDVQETKCPVIEPGELAPPADPGQKNFGGSVASRKDTSLARAHAREFKLPVPQEVSFENLSMSDPYIFADEATKTYYLTSSGGMEYKSKDLKTWYGPCNVIDIKGLWFDPGNGRPGFCAAAEIHKIGDKYYYAGTWSDHAHLIQQVERRYNVPHNQTYLLRSDSPEGPFVSFAKEAGYDYEPHDWDCIDGTLYQEDGKVYLVFVHEWTQIIDGTMAYVELAPDLTYTVSKTPVTIFRATEAPWSKEMNSIGEATFGLKMPGWVTDGPEMFRTKSGRLGMLWSSWGLERYCQGIAWSESGKISGPWVQEKDAFLANNSGHGMLFRTFEGKLLYVVHHAEGNGPRKPQLWEVDDSGNTLVLGKRYDLNW